ncbi:imidazolonepropionase [Bacteroidia bacterium]|nr:imidazolonepropionase [Bacteroidia bacterium]GHT04076.1 imidazolonepropionase [Bacteroidia bacterium]GHT52648.1 imidazolonepropionase [Bacteroidia bacterium]
MNNYIIKNITQLVTCSGFSAKHGQAMSDLGIIENGMVIITGGIISYVGASSEFPVENPENYEIIDATGKAVLPGFIDSHTHFVFGGYREEEFSWRMHGDSYMSIMQRGGGIYNTVRATQAASFEELKAAAKSRLDKMLAMGVTTVEGKSGYGLDKETELKQLRVMQALNAEHPIDIVSTYLGAHAVPKGYSESAYIDFMLKEVLPIIKEEGLAENCDIFCEKGVFSTELSKYFLLEAKKMGFQLKIHADEIVNTGGAELAAEIQALSADHLLQASEKGISALAQSNTVATLLPCTAFSLKEEYAQGRQMIDAGCAVALATDYNPGSCFSSSIPLTIALACIYMKLSPEEAVTALTINAAAALGKEKSIGSIDVGKKGDIIILEYPSYKFLPYHVSMNCVSRTIKSQWHADDTD